MNRPQFIYFIEPARPEMPLSPTDEEKAIVGEHFQYLTAQREAGNLIMAVRTLESPFIGMAIYEADDEAAARQFADSDPGIVKGVFKLSRVQSCGVALLRT